MDYLVQMKLANSSRPKSPEEGISFIERVVFPTLEGCKKLDEEKKILAGGPVSGSIALALIVRAETIQELDELFQSLPIWPRMETTVIPLTSFDGRMVALRPGLERLRTKLERA